MTNVIDDLEKIEVNKLERMSIGVQIVELENELREYDYIGVKIAMGVASIDEYADEIAYTERLRERIRELEALL